MNRVTADSNLYISALNFGGTPLEFLNVARSGAFRLAISEAIVLEVNGVLSEKFRWSSDRIEETVRELRAFAEFVVPRERLQIVTEDPDDDRVLECAVASGSQFIVSGDKHLLVLGEYQGIRIIKVAEFLTLVPKPPASAL